MTLDTIVTGSKLTAIADALREALGTSDSYTLDEIASAIGDISAGGGGGGDGAGAAKANVTHVFADGKIASADLEVTAEDMLAAADEQGNVNLDLLAFFGCERLLKVTIPAGAYMSPGAFSSCLNLEEVVILGELIYSYTSKEQPVPYWSSPSFAPFTNCPALRSLDLSSMRPYGSAGNKQLPQYLCYGDKSLTSFAWPTDTRWKKLGTYMLAGCSSLTTTTLPANFTQIPGSAFAGTGQNTTYYSALEEITFLGDVTTVTSSNYGEAFQTSSAQPLRRIIFEGNTAVPTLSSAYLFFTYGKSRAQGFVPTGFEGIYVPDDLLDSWQAANNWSVYASIIKPLSEIEG